MHNVWGAASAGDGYPFVQTQRSKVLHVHPAQRDHLTLPANILWSIKRHLIDGARVNLSASTCPTPLFLNRNYKVWPSLGLLWPDGIHIFQPLNEIRPNGASGDGDGS